MKTIKLYILTTFLFFTFTEMFSASNKTQGNIVSSVLSRYKNETSKLEAARFLLSNIDAHYTIYSKRIDSYYQYMDSIFTCYNSRNAEYHKLSYDTACTKFGPFDLANIQCYDSDIIDSEYLCQQIDEAFETWKKPWNADVSFNLFCEYVLPYRIAHEPLSNWRRVYRERYKQEIEKFQESQSNYFLKNYIYSSLNQKFNANIYIPHMFLPDFSLAMLLKMKVGNCNMNAMRNVAQLRAVGIPSTIDFTPQWGNRSLGHSWGIVFLNDTTFLPFGLNERLGDHFGFRPEYKLSKVYRNTFSKHREMSDIASDTINIIPEWLQNSCMFDVTDKYVPTSDVRVPLYRDCNENDWVYLCTFDNFEWIPVAFSRSVGKYSVFPKMGREMVYLPMIINDDGELCPVGFPFILDKYGKSHEITPSKKKEKIRLIRKYNSSYDQQQYCKGLNGGKFQVANKRDFSDSITIHTIRSIKENRIYSVKTDYKGNYKYFRYLAPKNSHANMAEIYMFDAEGKRPLILPNKYGEEGDRAHGPDKMYDRNVLTSYIMSKEGTPWGAVEFNESVNLKEIRFAPRNDGNFIYENDNYELFYWDKTGWKSISKIKGTKEGYLYVDNVPIGALLLLHNSTRGKEERIFTYQDGKQIWW